jgi:hypothetical protein
VIAHPERAAAKLSAFIDADNAHRKLKFAADSPVEEAGFETSVPGSRERGPPIVREQVANRFPGA